MNLQSDYVIKNMEKDDLKLAIEWAKNEGWNPGIFDVDSFYQTDPSGFFMGYLGQEPISCVSAVAYDDKFGFLGFYIVKPDFRGKGFGITIWNKGIKHLQKRNIGLDGVPEQQENYKKYGFKLAYKNIRYSGIIEQNGHVLENLRELKDLPIEKLIKYDSKMFPTNRSKFIKKWINQNQSRALGFLSDNDLQGYGVISPCYVGFKIGPLFAEDEQIAQELFRGLTTNLTGKIVYLDIPEPNSAAISFATKNNMKKTFETARMYNKEIPKLPIDQIFGITTFELG